MCYGFSSEDVSSLSGERKEKRVLERLAFQPFILIESPTAINFMFHSIDADDVEKIKRQRRRRRQPFLFERQTVGEIGLDLSTIRFFKEQYCIVSWIFYFSVKYRDNRIIFFLHVQRFSK